MYHYKARIYSPTLGRFLQTGPIGYEDNINLYAYVGNDPIGNTDPSGETCVFVTGSNGSNEVCQRALRYQAIANDFYVSYLTSLFSAASAVVNTLASANLGGSVFTISAPTRNFLNETGAALETANLSRLAKLKAGLLGNGSRSQNDRDFVRYEQREVQGYIDALSPSDRKSIIGEINTLINGGTYAEYYASLLGLSDSNVRSAISKVQENLGGDIDYGNEDHRVALGDELTRRARQAGNLCRTTGSRIRTC